MITSPNIIWTSDMKTNIFIHILIIELKELQMPHKFGYLYYWFFWAKWNGVPMGEKNRDKSSPISIKS